VSEAALTVVLGGSGFLGRHLCRSLLTAGCRVRSISRSGAPKGPGEPWSSQIEWIPAALGTPEAASALRQADSVFHLACTTLPSNSNADPAFDLESNLVATVRTLEAAAILGVRRLVFVSSGGTVYGPAQQVPIPENHPTDPICSYGIHKLAVEKYLHLFRVTRRLDSMVLRVANMYGESQDCSRPLGAIAHFTDHAVKGQPIEIWGDGRTLRDYVHVEDVVAALVRAAAYAGKERLFNIGSGRGVSLLELVEMLRSRISKPLTVQHLPGRECDVAENVLDIGRARRELGWFPAVTLEMGLERMIGAATAARPPLAPGPA